MQIFLLVLCSMMTMLFSPRCACSPTPCCLMLSATPFGYWSAPTSRAAAMPPCSSPSRSLSAPSWSFLTNRMVFGGWLIWYDCRRLLWFSDIFCWKHSIFLFVLQNRGKLHLSRGKLAFAIGCCLRLPCSLTRVSREGERSDASLKSAANWQFQCPFKCTVALNKRNV